MNNNLGKVTSSVGNFLASLESSKNMFASSFNAVMKELDEYITGLEAKVVELTEEVEELKKEK